MKRRGPKLTLGSYYYCCCCSSSSHVVIEKKFVCFFGVSFLSFSLLLLLVGWWMMKKKRKMFVRLMNDEKNLAGTIVLDIVGGVSPSCKCRSTGVIGYLVWCSSLLLCFACLFVCCRLIICACWNFRVTFDCVPGFGELLVLRDWGFTSGPRNHCYPECQGFEHNNSKPIQNARTTTNDHTRSSQKNKSFGLKDIIVNRSSIQSKG